MTAFAPYKAPKLIAGGQFCFDERVVLDRVGPFTRDGGGGCPRHAIHAFYLFPESLFGTGLSYQLLQKKFFRRAVKVYPTSENGLQGYLAHKKHPPPRTLP